MTRSKSIEGGSLSRRSFLSAAAIGGGALFGAGLVGASAAEAKLPQAAAKYQATPKGKQQCDKCALWQPPESCKLVDGKIAPSGWCVLYQAKK